MSTSVSLPVIQNEKFLLEILDEAKEYSPRAYILSTFLAYSGLKLNDIISLRAKDVAGTSYYVEKYQRLFIYSDSFANYINSYIENEGLLEINGYVLCKTHDKSSHMYQSEASDTIINFLRSIGYRGSATTFSRTFFFLFALNHGPIDPIQRKAYESTWIENTLGIPYAEYKEMNGKQPSEDLIKQYSDSVTRYINEVVRIVTDPETPVEVREQLLMQVSENYKCLYLYATVV